MEKVCFVVQRYGSEVNGGAELQCRQFAEHMSEFFEIHVATTKAIDYISWKNEYTSDFEMINNVHVHRFPVAQERDINVFNEINGEFLNGHMKQDREKEWVDKQGPLCPALIDYIRDNKDEYKAFVFFTYLYYPTVIGISEVKNKAIVVPEAHNEPYLKMKIFDKVFTKPRAFFFNTDEERALVHKKYHNEKIPYNFGGAGVEVPEDVDGERFREKYDLDNYMVYVGRIDEGKCCNWLFKYFIEYKKRNKNDIKLVLMGKPVIPVPKHPDIISLGFVSETDKFDGIAGAKMLVLPSEFESLSIVVLEAMSVFTPTVVNGNCEVLKGHCFKSNGALYYENYFEFEAVVNYILTHPDEVEIMVKNAKKYVDENYQWDVIVKRFKDLIDSI